MRLIAAAETLSSVPAAAKLPVRAAASNALMPFRNRSRRMPALRKTDGGQDNSVCAAAASATSSLAEEISHVARPDRKSTRLNSSHTVISYAVFCLKKKKHYVKYGSK